MLKEKIRLVNKVEPTRATTHLGMAIYSLKQNGVRDALKYISDICNGLAEIIVSLTKETDKEEFRNKAVAKARNFDNTVLQTLHRGFGHCGGMDDSLYVQLDESDILNNRAFMDVINMLYRLTTLNNNTLDDVVEKGALMVAELIHVCGFSEIDMTRI